MAKVLKFPEPEPPKLDPFLSGELATLPPDPVLDADGRVLPRKQPQGLLIKPETPNATP